MKLYLENFSKSKNVFLYDTAPFAMFLYEMVLGIKPKLIFEIGVYKRGISTLSFLDGLRTLHMDNPEYSGELWSLDIEDYSNTIPPANESRKYWKFIKSDSNEYYKNFRQPIDILLIDGDHSYSSVKNDYDHYMPWVTPGGYILLHDTLDSQGVIKFWNSDYIKYPKVELRWQYGLGIIHKIT